MARKVYSSGAGRTVGMRGSLKLDGMTAAIQRVDDVGDRARAPEPALRAAGTRRDLQESEKRRFSHRRGWARLTPRWAAEKRRRGLDPRVLRATGRLYSALVNAVRSDGVRHDVFNRELRWGIRRGRSNVYYAQALAKGWGETKPRRMVVIDKPARASIAGRVEKFIAFGFLDGGGRA